jgi:hypothetical protein
MGDRRISIDTTPSKANVYQADIFNNNQKIWLGTTPLENQTVYVLTGVKGKTSRVNAYSSAAAMNMVLVFIEKEGYKPCWKRLAVEENKTLEYKIELEPLQ